MAGRESITLTVLVIITGAFIMWLVPPLDAIPTLAGGTISLVGALIFWALVYVLFGRFEFVRLILKDFDPQQQDDEDEEPEESVDPRYFVGGHKRPDERPQSKPPEPKGITKDSEDPRKYLR